MYHWNSRRIPVFAWKVWELAVRRRAGGVHLWTGLAVRAIAPAARFVSCFLWSLTLGNVGDLTPTSLRGSRRISLSGGEGIQAP